MEKYQIENVKRARGRVVYRATFSQLGRNQLRKDGSWRGYAWFPNNNENAGVVLVVWEGQSSPHKYHEDFIDFIDE